VRSVTGGNETVPTVFVGSYAMVNRSPGSCTTLLLILELVASYPIRMARVRQSISGVEFTQHLCRGLVQLSAALLGELNYLLLLVETDRRSVRLGR
jgi:hypothetical protein